MMCLIILFFIDAIAYFTIVLFINIRRSCQGLLYNYFVILCVCFLFFCLSFCFFQINNTPHKPPYIIIILSFAFSFFIYCVLWRFSKEYIREFIHKLPPGSKSIVFSLFLFFLFYFDLIATNDILEIIGLPIMNVSIVQRIISISFLIVLYTSFIMPWFLIVVSIFSVVFFVFYRCRYKDLKISNVDVGCIGLFFVFSLISCTFYINATNNYFSYFKEKKQNSLSPLIFDFYYHNIPGFCDSVNAQDYRNKEGKMIFLNVEGKASFAKFDEKEGKYYFDKGECYQH